MKEQWHSSQQFPRVISHHLNSTVCCCGVTLSRLLLILHSLPVISNQHKHTGCDRIRYDSVPLQAVEASWSHWYSPHFTSFHSSCNFTGNAIGDAGMIAMGRVHMNGLSSATILTARMSPPSLAFSYQPIFKWLHSHRSFFPWQRTQTLQLDANSWMILEQSLR